MSKINWEGVYPAMLTPFTAGDEIDFPMFEKNVKAQMEAGSKGIILAGSLGEGSTLDSSEKNQLLKFAVEILKGKAPVVLTIAEQTTKVAAGLAQEAEKNGASGLMILPPMRYKADDRETVQYFKTIAANTSLPIMVYNNPVDYKIEVTPDMFEELAKVPTIQAVKESTRDVTNVTRMRNRFGNRFKLLCGVDTLFMEETMLGVDGLVGGLVDAFPRETIAIFELVKANRYEEALAIYRWFLPLLELDIHPKLVQYIKLAAVQTGLCTENVRAPRLPLEGAERERVLATIAKAIATRPTLPDYIPTQSLVNA
ncbi:dihydrodipicolinate synthase family protein [Pseudoflavitalea sp. G-6-1-2]|uniref:dihydrodipicolinate synthase family protein n=1 Tax=Pseudoflavitalea sp. G-6-1-2 TaxID=2728841 RepID=UPI00146C9A24|nr:dihydrodipicolinate synthase family protein [Pseudoflavitalea sp. G-6-1-2]NML19258.1 dihydrodipicolinate synthase family protein [Pseudoflavitalea sp. G-6-1-2]